jgi:Flp pilus assembly protein TadG
MRALRIALSRFCRANDGVGAVELAIIAPVVILGTLCAADLGRFALQKTWVIYAASGGAEYAVVHGFNADKITTAATSAAPVSGISISPDPSEFYGCATSTGVTASTQGATCPSESSTGATAGTYVTVTATMPFTAIFSAAGIIYPSSLSATAVVRIQ